MRARSLLLGILVAACLVALAGVSWAGGRRVTGYPWGGTGKNHGWQNQHPWQGNGSECGPGNHSDRAAWKRDGDHDGGWNRQDRDPWQGNRGHGSWNDDPCRHDRTERFRPPWGGPLIDGRRCRGTLF